MSKKFEQLLEYVVNDDMDKAQAMFHEIVVAKSREIYENLIADEAADDFSGDQVEEFVDSIEADDAAIGEDELMGDEEDAEMHDEEDMGDEDAMGDEDEMDSNADSESGVEDMEDRLVDLEDALSQLKAEFDSMMTGDAHDEEGADMHDHTDSEEPADETADEMDEDSIFVYKEHAPKPVLTDSPGNGTSPVAKNAKSPTGTGKPVVVKDGAAGNHGVKTPGKLTTATTAGEGTKMKKVQDMKKI